MQTVEGKSVVVPLRMNGALAAKLDKAVRLLRSRSRDEFIREEAIEEHVEARTWPARAARIEDSRESSTTERPSSTWR